jgi:hypothetical protein
VMVFPFLSLTRMFWFIFMVTSKVMWMVFMPWCSALLSASRQGDLCTRAFLSLPMFPSLVFLSVLECLSIISILAIWSSVAFL